MTTRVLVTGGGVAALEAAAALRALAGARVEITLVARMSHFETRATAVSALFEQQPPAPVSIGDLARQIPFDLRLGELDHVDTEQHAVHLRDAGVLPYDRLIVCTGAVPIPRSPGRPRSAARRTRARSPRHWTARRRSRSWPRPPRIGRCRSTSWP